MSVISRPAASPSNAHRPAGHRLASDMVLVHKVFRREFGMMPRLIQGVDSGDVARAGVVGAHCRELATALRHHHGAEAELLWPRVSRRTGLDPETVERLRDGQRAHESLLVELDGLLPLWEQTADPDLQAVLADILTELQDLLTSHLAIVERSVLPAVDGVFSTAEWLALGLRAASWIPLHRMAWMLGALLEDATAEERDTLMAKVPGPARLLYRMVGKDQYAREMRELRRLPA